MTTSGTPDVQSDGFVHREQSERAAGFNPVHVFVLVLDK